jgi:hypothetical protein
MTGNTGPEKTNWEEARKEKIEEREKRRIKGDGGEEG